jgi:hypothetical protein
MEMMNFTKLQVAYTVGTQPDGRDVLVVVAKTTFCIPANLDGEPEILDEQVPLVLTDVFSGEPGFSAPLYESDFAPRKPRCDVLFNGSAYAPGNMAVRRVRVSLRVDSVVKSFDVVGDRVWQVRLLNDIGSSEPKPFTIMPISYDRAFGGVDRPDESPASHRWYPSNHAGRGYHENVTVGNLDGKPMPNTEQPDNPIRTPRGRYRPQAFGPIGRAWHPRIGLAGTYDKNWIDNVMPFLPADFDEAYYQAAPLDQQVDFLRGGEEVELTNLTPQGKARFRVPKLTLGVVVLRRDGAVKEVAPLLDTVVLEPDNQRFTLAFRATVPLRKNICEVRQVSIENR